MDNILRIPSVMALTGLSRVSIWRKVRAGQFPAPLELSANTIGWPEAEVAQWQASRPRRTYGAEPSPELAAPVAPAPAATESAIGAKENNAAPQSRSTSPAKKRKRGAPAQEAAAAAGDA
jgi:prophage regulatory protein